MKQREIPVTACVRRCGSVPTLFVDGAPCAAAAYMTYCTDKNDYASFAQAGYRLFSLPVFFATRSLNEKTDMILKNGVFEVAEPDYSGFDRDMADILAACPDAWIFPRVNTTLPRAWDRAHPDELCDTFIKDEPCVCFSSDLWAEEVKRLLRLFIRHVQEAPYAAHVIGYQIAGGNTEEWIPFDLNGSEGRRSREAFALYCAREVKEPDEKTKYRFLSRVFAKRLMEFGQAVKEETENRLIVGAFYGYTAELPDRALCHHAAEDLLDCPYLDFFCSPVSYRERNQAFRDHANMLPADSLKLHGKLYFAEADIRTDLTRAYNGQPYYNLPVWFGPDRALSLKKLDEHFARFLTHGHGFWWFDMWGGWYDHDDFRRKMQAYRAVTEQALALPMQSAARLAVFLDEQAYDGVKPEACAFVAQTIDLLGVSGVPYDVFHACDFDAVAARYPAKILLVPSLTERGRHILEDRDVLLIDGRKAVTTDGVRAFCRARGAGPVTEGDAVAYENASFLFVLPRKDETIVFTGRDAYTGETVKNPFLRAGQGYLFRKE